MPLWVQIVASLLALAVLVVQLSAGASSVDTTSVLLIVLVLLPWLLDYIQSFELAGVAKLSFVSATEEELAKKAATDLEATSVRLDESAAETERTEALRQYGAFEKALRASLVDAGFRKVKSEVAIDFGSLGRFVPDAIAEANGTTFIVEAKPGLTPKSARDGVRQLERLLHLFDVASPSERVVGVLVFGGTSSGDLLDAFGRFPTIGVSLAAFDPGSHHFDFPYGDPPRWPADERTD